MLNDVVVLLPGITGSVLARRDRRDPSRTHDVWNFSASALWSAIRSGLGSLEDLLLADDDADDGIVATKLVSDITIIPGFWKIDGYSGTARYLIERLGLRPGENYFDFPYDWRRSNARGASALESQAMDWLGKWREKSGAGDAKLVLIAHSMGGLVSRYFLEQLGGWKHTRALFTFGTPFQGSLNAVDFLVHGMKLGMGPLGVDLTPLLRSFPSVYELLPTYDCVDSGGDALGSVRAAVAKGLLPQLERARVERAAEFHEKIRAAQRANANEGSYKDSGYATHPVVGIEQPTNQSVRIAGRGVEILKSYQGEDELGDGTVPRRSAVPLELEGLSEEIYGADCHASLQNEAGVLANVRGVLTEPTRRARRAALPVTLRLALDDVVAPGAPARIRVQPVGGSPPLFATLTNLATLERVGDALARAEDGWQKAEFDLAPGSYRVTVSGEGGTPSVTDLFLVAQ
jgi:hypothetical protein